MLVWDCILSQKNRVNIHNNQSGTLHSLASNIPKQTPFELIPFPQTPIFACESRLQQLGQPQIEHKAQSQRETTII